MKNKLKITTLFLLLMGFSISCEKNEETKNIDEDMIASKLTFVDINTRLASFGDKKPVVIVEWNEWGRKKKKCRGWGLCNAVWFPPPQEKSVSTNPDGGASILEYDDIQDKYYVDILLAAPVPNDITLEDIILRIDEEIELVDIQTLVSRDLTFPVGSYSLDTSLGNYGGYRIYFN